jgi:hypothetical protein
VAFKKELSHAIRLPKFFFWIRFGHQNIYAESGAFAYSPMKSGLTVLLNDLAKSDSVDLDQRLAPYKKK